MVVGATTARLHALVDEVDWGSWSGAHGPTEGFGRDLHEWLDGRPLTDGDMPVVDVPFHQGGIHPVAEPLAPILVAVLASDRTDLHADALQCVQAAVCSFGLPHQADGFDQWRHPWPPALLDGDAAVCLAGAMALARLRLATATWTGRRVRLAVR